MRGTRFSKDFRKGGKCHGPFLHHLSGENDVEWNVRSDHPMHSQMRHGHPKLHKMKHGHFKHHKMERVLFKHHRQESHHKMGLRHMKLHKMKHGFHKMGFRHHKMGHGHHKFGHNHGLRHRMGRSIHKIDCERNHSEDEETEFQQIDSENMDESSRECNPPSKGEIRTYEPKSKAEVSKENNKFQICLDTSSYQPEEVCVKIVKGGKIDISAIHESVDDDLYEFHEMYRSFALPEGVNPDNVTSHLDSDGKLTVEAPINLEKESSTVREILITRMSE